MLGTFNPYLFKSSSGSPDSAKVSLIATISWGIKKLVVIKLAIKEDNPPWAWCSSTVTTALVILKCFKISSLSKGFTF